MSAVRFAESEKNDSRHSGEETPPVIPATPSPREKASYSPPTHSLPIPTSISDFITSSYCTHTARFPLCCFSNVSMQMAPYETYSYLRRHLYYTEFAGDIATDSLTGLICRYGRMSCRYCEIKCRVQRASEAAWAGRDPAAVIMVVLLPPSESALQLMMHCDFPAAAPPSLCLHVCMYLCKWLCLRMYERKANFLSCAPEGYALNLYSVMRRGVWEWWWICKHASSPIIPFSRPVNTYKCAW